MTDTPDVRALVLPLTVLVVATIAGLAWPAVANDYWLSVAIELLKWIALAQSWVLISGLTGYISLGHVAFFGIGGYVTVLFWQGLGLWLTLPLAGLAAAAAALIVGAPCLRVRGPYFVILTFGVAEFLKFAFIATENAIGSFGRLVIGGPSLQTVFYILLGLAIAASVLTYVVGRSRFGRGLVSIREDETAAETIGVPTARLKLAAYVLSAFIPGVVGGVMALRSSFFDIPQAFDPIVSFTIVTVAIVGGAATVWGPILGSVFLVALHTTLWSTWPQVYMIILGVLLMAFVLFLPGGLTAGVARLFGRRRAPSGQKAETVPAETTQADGAR